MSDKIKYFGRESFIEDFVSYSIYTAFDDLPQGVVKTAKNAILDCTGCMIAGASEPAGMLIKDMVEKWGGNSQSVVIGSKTLSSPPYAALANGTMAHALDYDDVHWNLIWHPSVAILPPCLALAEYKGLSGKELITAYVLGVEFGCRLGMGMTKKHYENGWHTTSTLGSMGAAIASSKLLKLDHQATQRAVGIAASLAGGLRGNFGTMTKPFHAGNAAHNGVVGAMLGENGFTADPNIIESPVGFCNAFCGQGEYDVTEMGLDIGKRFQIVDPGIMLKLYPTCASTHQAIDGILFLANEYNITPEEVKEIEVLVSCLVPNILIHHDPCTPLQAKFSMEYCISVALVHGQIRLNHFAPEMLKDKDIRALAKKVKMSVHPEMARPECFGPGEDFTEIIIKKYNGEELSHRVQVRTGDVKKPLSENQLFEKYRQCSLRTISPEKAGKSMKMLMNLEKIGDVGDLMMLLSGKQLN